VIRAGVLLLLLLPLQAQAQTAASGRFDSLRAATVYAAALEFMGPRILDPVTVPDLIAWGLGGVAAIDPKLRADIRDKTLRLRLGDKLLLVRPIPAIPRPMRRRTIAPAGPGRPGSAFRSPGRAHRSSFRARRPTVRRRRKELIRVTCC